MDNKTIGIIDYDLGNLRSVSGAISRVGYTPVISDDPEVLRKAHKLILPGVGAFGDGIGLLKKKDLISPLQDIVLGEKKPILAICLGMQLLTKSSCEFGKHEGLGWIDAHVKNIPSESKEIRIPHVGWNDLIQKKSSILFEGLGEDDLFYYVHSFHVVANEPSIITGTCNYGTELCSSIEKNNIYATQFHPEKSQLAGLRLLKNFLDNA